MASQVTIYIEELKADESRVGKIRQDQVASNVSKFNHDVRLTKTAKFNANHAPISTQLMIGSIPISLIITPSEAPTRQEARTLESPQQVHQHSATTNKDSQVQIVKFISTSDNSSNKERTVVEKPCRSQSVVIKAASTNGKSKNRASRLRSYIPVEAFKAHTVQGAFSDLSTTLRPSMVPVDSQITRALSDTNNSTKPEIMSVMVTSTSTIEEQLEEMKRMIAEKDAQIAALSAQVAAQVKISGHENDENNDRELNIRGQGSTITSLQDLKTLIADGVREAYMSSNSRFYGYLKPYPAHYDALPFPKGYQKPTFDKFDGIDGSPHEHLAHFHSACGETSQSDALLVRQFVQSLKGAAFSWYSQLEPGSILTWDDMQREFLAQFVSSKKKVTIIDLADAKQRPDESTTQFISRWRSLNLQCSEKLTELSAVQICSNNLIPEIATYVSTAEPHTFEALVSIAGNVERQVARKKYMARKASFNDHINYDTDESLATFVKTDSKLNSSKGNDGSRKITLKERKQVKYSFDDDEVVPIFSQLINAQAIELPKPKRQSEVNKTSDPRYCQYHRLVGHSTKDCFVLRNIIQEMVNNKEIEVKTSSTK